MDKPKIAHIGLDISTTAVSAGGITEDGQEVFAAVPMRGATAWYNDPAFPAFDLTELPGMIGEALDGLSQQGYTIMPGGGISWSVRQHDMVLLGHDNQVLRPALSWQCEAAAYETALLRSMGAEGIVGRIEERFILPKLLCVLKREPDLVKQIKWVMTTGDWLDWVLRGGEPRLSTSDGLSNALLVQVTKELAVDVFRSVGLRPEWFPQPIQSGTVTGEVRVAPATYAHIPWESVMYTLYSRRIVAGLGDNHATAVGCSLADLVSMIVSGGSSGTVTRLCQTGAALVGEAARFEYYARQLLLMMVADCATRYGRFLEQYGGGRSHAELNQLALEAAPANLMYAEPDTGLKGKPYPAGWEKLSLGEKAASLQLSLVADLSYKATAMLREVQGPQAPPIGRIVMTGGLSQAPLIRAQFAKNFPGFKVLVSDRTGPMAYQTAVLGALINAMVGTGAYKDLEQAVEELCPLKPAVEA